MRWLPPSRWLTVERVAQVGDPDLVDRDPAAVLAILDVIEAMLKLQRVHCPLPL